MLPSVGKSARIRLFISLAIILVIIMMANSSFAEANAVPVISVNADHIQHTISSGIYGVNLADESQGNAWRLPVNRWGGNGLTRYNWQIDVWNPGNYWYYENANNPDPGTLPVGSAADRFVQQNRRTGTDSLMQVPMLGWVPKDRNETCGFAWDTYGGQTDADWSRSPACGDGISAETNQPITGNDPTDTSMPIDSSFVGSWVQHLVSQFGPASSGGVGYYALDNEPMIWYNNHRDVRPEWTGYDEVRDRSFEYGAAIKAADPSAKILGPSVWGWGSYFHSSLDLNTVGSNPDRDRYQMDFIPWYLQQMQQFEQQNGYRLLDYLDVHFYPQAYIQQDDQSWVQMALGPAGNADAQALRLRSTRELWDWEYTSESWIGETVYAIPRMKQWIDQYYPGTRLVISEYAWGGLEDMNGALAQADVLGIFGREDIEMAFLWPQDDQLLALGQPIDHVFRLFRNYDGAGSSFGNQSLNAYTSDSDQISVYGSRVAGSNKMTVMVINKTLGDISTPLQLHGQDPYGGTARRFRYSPANMNNIEVATITTNDWTINDTFPAESITLYEVAVGAPVEAPTAVGGNISAEITQSNTTPTLTFLLILLALTITSPLFIHNKA